MTCRTAAPGCAQQRTAGGRAHAHGIRHLEVPDRGVRSRKRQTQPADDAPDRTCPDADRLARRIGGRISLRRRGTREPLGHVGRRRRSAPDHLRAGSSGSRRRPGLVAGWEIDCVRLVARATPVWRSASGWSILTAVTRGNSCPAASVQPGRLTDAGCISSSEPMMPCERCRQGEDHRSRSGPNRPAM